MWRYLLNILDYFLAGVVWVIAVLLFVGFLGLLIMNLIVLIELMITLIV